MKAVKTVQTVRVRTSYIYRVNSARGSTRNTLQVIFSLNTQNIHRLIRSNVTSVYGLVVTLDWCELNDFTTNPGLKILCYFCQFFVLLSFSKVFHLLSFFILKLSRVF
jgi:hypothetical protein